MFPTFTGSSRRPRNVNMSGQRNTNPWATSSWAPSTSGASKTVAQAQAEREKRQKERDELNAAKRLQRVWRGHKDRQDFKQTCREDYDAFYKQPIRHDLKDRVISVLPLLLVLFDPARTDDQQRLDIFIQDLVRLGSAPSNFDLFSLRSWDRLAELIVGALERRPVGLSQAHLNILVDIVKRRQASIIHILTKYYKLLSKFFEQSSLEGVSIEEQNILADAATAPLVCSSRQEIHTLQAYKAFAFSFLTSPNLSFLQTDPARIAGYVNLRVLSQSVIDTYSQREDATTHSKNDSLWLLVHFIALNRVAPTSQGTKYLEALYLQLSILVDDIRVRYDQSGTLLRATNGNDDTSDDNDDDAEATTPLSAWMTNQLDFLVDEDGISELLSRLSSTAMASNRLSEDASLLAGYTLVLLRCFPSHSDDIKMRLFQGDISATDLAGSTLIPSVKYFWKAASNTSIFKNITQSRTQPTSVVTLLQPDPVRDREWRTILLFLELYNFLLRLTDDEDFLPAESQIISQQSLATFRIRSSGLNLEELKRLINFLKSLSFPLYYNLPDIMPSTSRSTRLNAFMGVSSGHPTAREEEEKVAQSSFAGIIGMDVLGLRSASTATMRSLYERDSRRRFLPRDFWLMTSKFDMDGFISAVVLEEQQKDQMAEDGDDPGDSDEETLDTFHTSTGQRLSRAAQIERHRRLRRVQREQILAQVGPKLEILRNMPFAIPFEVRVQIFRQFVYLDKFKRRGGNVDPDRWRISVMSADGITPRNRDIIGRHSARVKRGKVFDDAFEQFYPLGESLKEPIQITFVDQFNQTEAGIDGGGVTKEFLTSVTDEAFKPGLDGHNLFVTNSQNLLYPNPTAIDDLAELLRHCKYSENDNDWRENMANLARRYEFLGRLVGKCMYEGILIDKAFAGFFLLKWSASGQGSLTDYRANLNDLRDLDPELYQGLINLKNYPGKVIDLSLDFTITDEVTGPSGEVRTITRPLCRNGEEIAVTNRNRPLYISYVVNYRLVAQPYRQTKAFLKGLGTLINPAWLSMFNQSELQHLVGGDSSEIDVEDLRRNTEYSGLYSIGHDGIEHPTVQMFWQVMREFQDSERREVLKYVTSTPRAPLLGFSQLSPHFTIRDSSTDEERLPSTSTCVNLLKLPRYSSKETLKRKLLYAIQSGAGFDLS
ncbi:hypothetical protein F4781DRAFT_414308 [Annulohypoxylon bovei var. microspora]|nr:hypothetical protein F4781DRAFT_414308 [Annulohypoxylon bovei var. microspora]